MDYLGGTDTNRAGKGRKAAKGGKVNVAGLPDTRVPLGVTQGDHRNQNPSVYRAVPKGNLSGPGRGGGGGSRKKGY